MSQLADYEVEAWDEYRAIIAKYDKSHRVQAYDRVSIHEAFPDIDEAFQHCLAMRTFRQLKDGT